MRHEPPRKYRQRPADWQRTYRQRVSAGKIVVHIEIDEVETVAALVAEGLLEANAADDKRAIAAAIEKVIAMLVRREA